MTAYYLDTSALVKRYVSESGAAWIVRLVDDVDNDVYTVRLTGPEMIAAFFRKARTGDVSRADAESAAQNFRADWQEQYQIVEVTVTVADGAMNLAEKHGLRGYDSVHLAAALALQEERQALELPPLIFISSDQQQLSAAAAEGLAIEDPNQH